MQLLAQFHNLLNFLIQDTNLHFYHTGKQKAVSILFFDYFLDLIWIIKEISIFDASSYKPSPRHARKEKDGREKVEPTET